MIDESGQPLLVCGYYTDQNQDLVFNTRNNQECFSTNQDDIIQVIKFCNGYNTVLQIANQQKHLEFDDVVTIIDHLKDKCVLIDSRELYLLFHEDSANTPRFFHKSYAPSNEDVIECRKDQEHLSIVSEIATNRCTWRDFSERNLNSEYILGIIQLLSRTNQFDPVPHAGGINGFTSYICIHQDKELFTKGIYSLDSITTEMKRVSSLDTGLLASLLNLDENLPLAGVTIFITSNLKKQADKYANRSYRYALIETGHLAQNLQLYCAEKDLAITENGGYMDEACANLLTLNYPNNAVLLSIIIGHKSSERKNDNRLYQAETQVYRFKDAYLGEGKILKYFDTRLLYTEDKSYYFSKIIFDGSYSHPSDNEMRDYVSGRSFATAQSHNMAFIKGCAESVERYFSSKVRIDKICSSEELNANWLHPGVITPWHKSMTDNGYFAKFNPKCKYEWVQGMNYESKDVIYALVENVYYPLYKSEIITRELVTECTSNGVCAHPNYAQAVKGALYELIERDALMVMWFSKRKPSSVSNELISDDILLRIEGLKRLGYTTHLLDISVDCTPVSLCLLVNNSCAPALFAGASANDDWCAAIEKSLDEAEFQLLSWGNPSIDIALDDIRTPGDHARWYAKPEHLQGLEWLINDNNERYTGQKVSYEYNPYIFILKEPDFEGDFWVVRAIEEELMPINFGYRYEHYGHSRLAKLGLKWRHDYPSIPHFFA